MILLDTSGLLAALFPDQRRHDECRDALLESEGPRLLSPFVLGELDYLVCRFAGVDVELDVLGEVASGVYELVDFSGDDVDEARRVIDRYSDLGIGLADASIVVLSRRYGIRDLLSLDERHFRTLRGADSRPFRLLPVDA